MDLPLESLHKFAFKAAEAANCAGEQGKYWEMHDHLYADQKTLDQLTDHAKAIGLDVPKFEECMNSDRQAAEIRRDMAEANKAGVSGTPAFFLAYTNPKSSKVTTEVRLTGAQPFASFKMAIDKLLAQDPAADKKK
jgi:protein-disulfide isomerase